MTAAVFLISLLLAGIGGAIGAVLRFISVEFFKKYTVFPAGVLFVNVIGTALLTIVTLLLTNSLAMLPEIFGNNAEGIAFFFNTGLLGAFTTFSAYLYDNFSLISEKKYSAAVLNILLNVCICFAVVLAILFAASCFS
ncbi:CrcB family protein [Methanimicrococcus sp. OttesenSCG-928-J09]|nr:CrcB family protein [Methanimicrococcus sp. OttesenSCG-928-J09]